MFKEAAQPAAPVNNVTNIIQEAAPPEVTLEMYINLRETHDNKLDKHDERITDLENQINLLKQMSQPKGDDGVGLIDALQDMINKLRIELNGKLDQTKENFSKAIDALNKKMEKFATID